MTLSTTIRLWWSRVTLRGLRRERARLHQMQAGIKWELRRNRRDTIAAGKLLAELDQQRRQQELARRFAVRDEA